MLFIIMPIITPAFLELMSRFILGPSLNLIFSRLTDSLEDVYKIYATNEDGDCTKEEDSAVKLEDTIFQALASITCMEIPHQPNEKSKEATKEDGKAEVPSTTSKAMFVRKKIEQTEFFSKRIVEYSSDEYLILALNNESGGVGEVEKMRKVFETNLRKFKKISIPATWLMLSICLHYMKQRTMTLQQCKEIAGKLGVLNPSLCKRHCGSFIIELECFCTILRLKNLKISLFLIFRLAVIL